MTQELLQTSQSTNRPINRVVYKSVCRPDPQIQKKSLEFLTLSLTCKQLPEGFQANLVKAWSAGDLELGRMMSMQKELKDWLQEVRNQLTS